MTLPRNVRFNSLIEKAEWLDASASLDAASPYLLGLASRLSEHRSAADYARVAHAYVRDSIAYERDPGGREQFADSESILRRGYDDCDGKSRVFVALIRAARMPGLEARIRPVFRKHPVRFVHVQAEVRYPGSETLARSEGDGWLLAELILRAVPLGYGPDMAAVGKDGKHLLAGPPVPRSHAAR